MKYNSEIQNVCNREEFRQWLAANHAVASECWANGTITNGCSDMLKISWN